jgi:acetolactate synthase-1/2/3 large subunit
MLPSDAIIFSDIGGHMLFNIHHLEIGRDQSFVINLGFGSMGHGTASPIGAALSCPDRPVIAIVGDGCFTMNGMELLAAVENELPVIWIVENNQMHGITWHASKMLSEFDRPIDTVRYRRQLNIADMAATMGLVSFRVERPGQIKGAFAEALQSESPCLIEVMVDPAIEPPLTDRVDTIQGFER